MKQYIIADLSEGLVNITEDQLLEIGGGVSVQESPKDLPKDFFISGWNRGTPSFLIYETDVPNRFFDLRQYVPTMLAVTEILRQPGTNNIICISGWTIGGVVQPIQVIKLIDCKIIDNVFTPSGFEFIEFTTTSATHGSDIDDEYIYISTRGTSANYLTVGTDIIKININNFDDNKKLVIEPSSGIIGRSSDIIEYNESLYTVISDSSNTRISKLVKINKNLNDYKSIITINDGTSNSADVAMPFAIYNDEVIMFGIDRTDTNSRNNVVVINVYSVTGQLKRKQRLILGSTGTVSYVPHWCTVVNNKLIVTPSGGGDTVADRYIIRVDIGKEYDNNSIILEEVTFSKMLVSDDNSLFSNGMLYIGNETGSSNANAKLIRMPYWDFTQQEVLYSDYSHLASLKIKTTKQTTRPFDTLFYKTKENLPLVGAINILYIVQEGLDKGIYEWYDGGYENLGGSGEIQDVSATESGIVNNTELQELGGVDKLINGVRIGRGSGSKEGNTALGEDALNSITTGTYNTGAGVSTLTLLTQGICNSAFGGDALRSVTVGEFNNAFGTSALQDNIFGISNNAFGCNALKSNVGVPILESQTKGHRSCAFGSGAMEKNTIGNGNAFGEFALSNQTTGLWNIGIGYQSGSGVTTGNNNTIVAGTGFVAKGGGITTGSNNLIVAPNNGNSTGVTTGSGNTILGKVTGLSPVLNNSVHLLNGIGEHAFRMNEDKSIDLPNLTKALINSGSDKSPVTKEWVNPQTTRPLLNTNFNTNDLIDGLPQYSREINLQNTSNIEITVKAGTFSTYFKGGVGAIKFVADTGRTLKLMDATETIYGIVGSYAKVKSFGTVDYIYINNYE